MWQCSGSITFWYGSGSSDPYRLLTDSAPDPALFVSDLKVANRKFFAITFWRYICIILHREKVEKSQNSRNEGFSQYFCLMMRGSGSVPLTNGSGSGRPKILRIWIRIRNTALLETPLGTPNCRLATDELMVLCSRIVLAAANRTLGLGRQQARFALFIFFFIFRSFWVQIQL